MSHLPSFIVVFTELQQLSSVGLKLLFLKPWLDLTDAAVRKPERVGVEVLPVFVEGHQSFLNKLLGTR